MHIKYVKRNDVGYTHVQAYVIHCRYYRLHHWQLYVTLLVCCCVQYTRTYTLRKGVFLPQLM
jgi:hypothetical protein